MIAPCYTKDRDQADRCVRACQAGTTITETFPSGATVTGRVQTVVENLDAVPKTWSVTFFPEP
jgi:hypothetical protein